MSVWMPLVPAFLGAIAVLLLPGLVVGWAAGLRRDALLVHAPVLTAVVLSTAAWLGPCTPWPWGLGALALTTGLVAAAVLAAVRLLRLPRAATTGPLAPLPRRDGAVLLALTALAGGVLAVVVARSGSPWHSLQVYDIGYHVNAIQHVATTGEPGPESVGSHRLWDQPSRGFYPPVLADLGALLLRAGAPDAVVAANLAMWVLVCVAWPLGVASLLRVVAPRAWGPWAVALVAATTTAPVPYLLGASAGYLPNTTGVLLLPGVVALAAALSVTARGRRTPPGGTPPRGGDRAPGADRTDRRELWRPLGLLALATASLVLVHPGAFFLAVALLLPLALAAATGVCRRLWQTGRRGLGAGLATGVALLGWAAAVVVLDLPLMARLKTHDVPAVLSVPQALREVLLLAPGGKLAYGETASFASWGAGALVLLGLARGLRRRGPLAWLTGSYLVVAALFVLAAAVDDDLSLLATSFWYNERARVGAALGVLVPVLVAWGAQSVSGWVERGAAAAPRSGAGTRVAAGEPVGAAARRWLPALTAAALVLALQPVAGWAAGLHMLRVPHAGRPGDTLTTPEEEAVYRSIPRGDPHESVIGSPWTGALLAGPLSGRRSVYAALLTASDPPRRLLQTRFKDYQRDPAVCREVQRLRIRYAVEDDTSLETFREARLRQAYRGVVDLAGTPGLTLVRGDGRTSVYEVAPCDHAASPAAPSGGVGAHASRLPVPRPSSP